MAGRGEYQSKETKKPKKDKVKQQSPLSFGTPSEPQVISKGKSSKKQADF